MSIPSLRQQMINEALDYHMNMNHVVFNRQKESVRVSGQDVRDPKQSDIIIEGTIRQKISDIMTNIQKIIQTVGSVTYEEPEQEVPKVQQGPMKIPGTSATIHPGIQEGEAEEKAGEVDGENAGPGSRGVTAVSAGQPRKRVIKQSGHLTDVDRKSISQINNSLASIVSGYNSLVDYIELQNRQKVFSQNDIQTIEGLVSQLVDPLKQVIGVAMRVRKGILGDMEYTRIYNVVIDIINKIKNGLPYVKIEVSKLSDPIAIREDYDFMAKPDINKLKSKADKLSNGIKKEIDMLNAYVPLSIQERDAKNERLQYLYSQINKIGSNLETAKQTTENAAREEREKIRLQTAENKEDKKQFKALIKKVPEISTIMPTIQNLSSKTSILRQQIDSLLRQHIDSLGNIQDADNFYRKRQILIDNYHANLETMDELSEKRLSLIDAIHKIEASTKLTPLFKEQMRTKYINDVQEMDNKIMPIVNRLRDISPFIEQEWAGESYLRPKSEKDRYKNFASRFNINPRNPKIADYALIFKTALNDDEMYDMLLNKTKKEYPTPIKLLKKMEKIKKYVDRNPMTSYLEDEAAEAMEKEDINIRELDSEEDIGEAAAKEESDEEKVVPSIDVIPTSTLDTMRDWLTYFKTQLENDLADTTKKSKLGYTQKDVKELFKSYKSLNKDPTIERCEKVRAFIKEKGYKGEGKPHRKGGHIHKTNDFGDEDELRPYLTRRLRPSVYRNNPVEILSSSEESSGDEGSGSELEINDDRLGRGKPGKKKRLSKKDRKLMEDAKIMGGLPIKEAVYIMNKKRGTRRPLKGGRKAILENDQADKDLWFM